MACVNCKEIFEKEKDFKVAKLHKLRNNNDIKVYMNLNGLA
jgi:hypothetical protein